MSARRQPVPPPPPSPPRSIHVVVPRHLPARELSRSPLEIKPVSATKIARQTRCGRPLQCERAATEAEGVGFEPTVACATTVFETVRFGRSRIPPSPRLPGALGREEGAEQR